MRKLLKVGVVGLAACAAMSASAQTNGPTGWSARLGIFLPGEDIFDGNLFAFGVDYKLRQYAVAAPVTGTETWIGFSGDFYGDGDNYNIPIVANYNVRQNQFVFSFGAGVGFSNLATGDDGIGLNAQIGVAYEFGNPVTPAFVQAKYFFSHRDDLNGFGVYVGIRF